MLRSNREKKRFAVHEFVIMPNHVHLLLTPAPENSLEKAIQFIKGGFSFRASREMNIGGEIWHKGFNEHRVKDAFDYEQHVRYMRENPVRAGLATRAEDFPFSTARLKAEADPAPGHLLRVSGQQSPA